MIAWLAFMNPTEPRWWAKYLRDGFRHVEILYLLEGQWILVRPLYGLTYLEACPWEQGDIPQHLFEDALIIPVEINPRERLRSLLGLHTCVSTIKAHLGIRAPHVITPWQLYKYCSARYAVIASSTGHPHSGSVDLAQAHPERGATGHGAPAGSL